MRAIHQSLYGTPDRLQLVDREVPAPGPEEVLIEVEASVVTQGDRRLRTGDFPGMTWLPGRLAMGITGPRTLAPGTMFAGRIAAIGTAVDRWAVGDAVFGESSGGAWAEQIVLGQDAGIAHRPESLTPEEAAALPFGANTARTFLSSMAGVAPGDRVAIVGAAGGVGRMSVQLARHLGAEVTAVCRPGHADLVRSLGAQDVMTLDDFLLTPARFDVVFDTTGLVPFHRARPAMTPSGRHATVYMTLRGLFAMAMNSLRRGQRTYTGVAMGDATSMAAVARLAEEGVFRPVIDKVFSLEEMAAAHHHLDQARSRGTVAIAIGDRTGSAAA